MRPWTAETLESCSWFRELQQLIQIEVDKLNTEGEDLRPAAEAEIQRQRALQQGWVLSLAKPDLNPTVRATIEKNLQLSLEAEELAQQRLRQYEATSARCDTIATAELIADRLNRLAEVLARNEPTRGNLELALHIESIKCNQDGRVIVRTCKLGSLAGDWDELIRPDDQARTEGKPASARYPGTPRRLARRRTHPDDADSEELRDAAEFACDPNRFSGLGPDWFWEDEFQIPAPAAGWASDHAMQVAEKRRSENLTEAQLAAYFGKSVPTIRKALKLAAERDPTLAELPRKIPRRRWEDSHFEEVWVLKNEGWSISQLCDHFGKCDKLIREAITLAEKARGLLPPESDKS